MASDKPDLLTIPKYNIWGAPWPSTPFGGIDTVIRAGCKFLLTKKGFDDSSPNFMLERNYANPNSDLIVKYVRELAEPRYESNGESPFAPEEVTWINGEPKIPPDILLNRLKNPSLGTEYLELIVQRPAKGIQRAPEPDAVVRIRKEGYSFNVEEGWIQTEYAIDYFTSLRGISNVETWRNGTKNHIRIKRETKHPRESLRFTLKELSMVQKGLNYETMKSKLIQILNYRLPKGQ